MFPSSKYSEAFSFTILAYGFAFNKLDSVCIFCKARSFSNSAPKRVDATFTSPASLISWDCANAPPNLVEIVTGKQNLTY